MIPISLNNFGYLRSKLPSPLYKNLLKECLQAERKNEAFYTGLTAPGTTPHYALQNKSNVEQLSLFVLEMRKAYDKNFPGLGNTGVMTKDRPYRMEGVWINCQRKTQFLPAHVHDGVYSFTTWIKIPYDYLKENPPRTPKQNTTGVYTGIKIPYSPCAGTFEFAYSNIFGGVMSHRITLSKKDEGDIIMFPSKLRHNVYPFYTSSGIRIAISGNILYDVGEQG